jgi:hypothetical protein
MGYKLLHFESELKPSDPEPHRVTAPAPTKRCGSLRLRLRNTAFLKQSFLGEKEIALRETVQKFREL